MNKDDFTIGAIISLSSTIVFFAFYITFFTEGDFTTAIQTLYKEKQLGEKITLCTFINFVNIFFMIFIKKDNIARWIFTIIIGINLLALFI